MKKAFALGAIIVITALTISIVDLAVKKYARDHGWT
jgi:hypothetical protein